MTDLVKNLAAQIVSLINSNPRSPTQAEIEVLVRKHYECVTRIMVDTVSYGTYPGLRNRRTAMEQLVRALEEQRRRRTLEEDIEAERSLAEQAVQRED